jgi:hypothetical protein
MRRADRFLALVGSMLLAAACRDAVEPAPHDAGRPFASTLPSGLNDPVLFYSTYLGGSDFDLAAGIAVDAAGNAYITGTTQSTNFPTTAGVFQPTFRGFQDVFLTKLNPTGSGLFYSTYLGGSDRDNGSAIAVDASGNVYVTGQTNSTDFPTTGGAFQTTFGGSGSGCSNAPGDAFVTKLAPTGSALIYSTYLGGSLNDAGFSIAIDASDNAYVTGLTISLNFPTTPGAFQPAYRPGSGCACSGTERAFVSKVNATGTSLVYSTYLDGSGSDAGNGIAVSAAGNATVTGRTNSPDFPTNGFGGGAFQPTPPSGATGCSPGDAFVITFNTAGSGLLYSTYLGGSSDDAGLGVALDALGDAYVTGITTSTNFPTLAAFQPALDGGQDAFVTKLNPMGTGLLYSTYLGGSSDDFGQGIALDALGNAYVAGGTSSANFPVTSGAPQATFGGVRDAFVTKLNPTGSGLAYSTYLGGSGDDVAFSITLDALPNPNAYTAGFTASTNFPTTSGAFQTTFGGGSGDAFVTKIANILLPPPTTAGKVTGGGSINVTGGIGTFGFIVQAQTNGGPVSGDLQYVSHAGDNVHSLTFTTLVIAGNTATFGGTCTDNGAACTFTVNVTDNGEPGTNDTFTISVSGGTPEGGMLRSGNILIH